MEWSDGSPYDFEMWAPGEPSDVDGSELCVEIYVTGWEGLWNDHNCNEYLWDRGFVCKAEKGQLAACPCVSFCLSYK